MYFQAITFSPKSWTGTYGEILLIPKDEGIGIIISDFQSKELGFEFAWDNLSDADLKRIIDFRSEKSSMDKYTAKLLQNGITLKKYLSREDNHFVVLFDYGNSNNKQRYWSYDHLVLQMED